MLSSFRLKASPRSTSPHSLGSPVSGLRLLAGFALNFLSAQMSQHGFLGRCVSRWARLFASARKTSSLLKSA